MRRTYKTSTVRDLPYGEIELVMEFENAEPLVFLFPKHRFQDFCFHLGAPLREGHRHDEKCARDKAAWSHRSNGAQA